MFSGASDVVLMAMPLVTVMLDVVMVSPAVVVSKNMKVAMGTLWRGMGGNQEKIGQTEVSGQGHWRAYV